MYENKAKLGTECASYVAGLVLTGEQVKLIRATKPRLSDCQVGVCANALWLTRLAPNKIKVLLTKAQLADIVNKASRFGARLVIKNMLISGHALIKATVAACKLESAKTNVRANIRAKRLALARQHINSVYNANIT
ncbi:MAG: hypothetical protein AAI978_00875 [Candidatus Hodgkinia cicadicola]